MSGMNESRTVDLKIEGMTCASCAGRVEKQLNSLDGVSATVNLATETASVACLVDTGDDALIGAVERTGYKARVARPLHAAHGDGEHDGHEGHDHMGDVAPQSDLASRLVFSALLTIPVFLLSMLHSLQFDGWEWIVMPLATVVTWYGAWPFHRAAALNARHGASTMDTLVSLGVIAAWTWSVVVMLFVSDGHVYFETAAVVTTFLLLGRYLEARAKKHSGAALEALMQMGARDVVVLESGGEVSIPVSQLRVGQRFVTKPGEKIATDGRVVEGSSSVDESMLTGESAPVRVEPGRDVIGATINKSGRLVVEATKVGADTALANIAKLVANAQAGKAPVQRLADRVSSVFVPIVIALAALTLVGWLVTGHSANDAFSAAVAVLIIACPCALGLATPTALLVGTGRGAQLGLLIKGSEVLESTQRIDTVVLDKTGTVTTGKMTLVGIKTYNGLSEEDALRIGASVESASEHPIGAAIVDAARDRGLEVVVAQQFASHEAQGVEGVVDGKQVRAGKPSFVSTQPIIMSSEVATAVALGWDNQVFAVFRVADAVKESSARAVSMLVEQGARPVLLTGDNKRVAAAVGKEVGIDNVQAEVLPKDKSDIIRALQDEGRVVAMVGDGVNDAPALAKADLGIAMGTGTDVAMQASDITVMSGDLLRVVDSIRLSRRTLSIIKSNLFWAFAYNVVAVPLAALGLLNPMIAGAAMAFSSVFVVLNSLRLRAFKGVSA